MLCSSSLLAENALIKRTFTVCGFDLFFLCLAFFFFPTRKATVRGKKKSLTHLITWRREFKSKATEAVRVVSVKSQTNGSRIHEPFFSHTKKKDARIARISTFHPAGIFFLLILNKNYASKVRSRKCSIFFSCFCHHWVMWESIYLIMLLIPFNVLVWKKTFLNNASPALIGAVFYF